LAGASAADTGQQANGTATRTLTATGPVAFSTKALSAPAGTISIVMTNRSAVPHNISIRGGALGAKRIRGATVGRNKVSRITTKLARGTYTFYCSVKGHERAGMRGTLRIR